MRINWRLRCAIETGDGKECCNSILFPSFFLRDVHAGVYVQNALQKDLVHEV